MISCSIVKIIDMLLLTNFVEAAFLLKLLNSPTKALLHHVLIMLRGLMDVERHIFLYVKSFPVQIFLIFCHVENKDLLSPLQLSVKLSACLLQRLATTTTTPIVPPVAN